MGGLRTPGRSLAVALTIASLLAVAASPARGSKEVVAYFGTEEGSGSLGGEFGRTSGQTSDPNDVAVNWTGAGAADRGDIYVVDSNNNRIQRFAQIDPGTPADPYDDEYVFRSAWGADVDATPSGGTDYEVCTLSADCKAASESAGNGTLSGNGGLSEPLSVAVDQDTGEVYVVDAASRVLVYDGEGTFLRTFGWDVVQSGPGNAGAEYEVCVAANGDVCKAGVSGAGAGQLGQGAPAITVSQGNGEAAVGTVFVGDPTNTRVDTYSLDGSSPSSFGSSAQFSSLRLNQLTVDSRGIVYVADAANGQEIDRYDSQNANGGGIGFLAPIPAPPLIATNNNGTVGMEIDPDSDGAGSETDVLYVLRTYSTAEGAFSVVQQFGPLNAPGLTVPPAAVDETHGTALRFNFARGFGLDPTNGRLFVATFANVGGGYNFNGPGTKAGVYVLDKAGGPPTATLDLVDPVTATTATIHATIDPNGGPTVSYRIEYSTDGASWVSTPETPVGSQETPQSIEPELDPPGTGLLPNTFYHVRLVATKAFAAPTVTAEKTFTTSPGAPLVESTGSPLRFSTTARLEGRVAPRGSATTYRFEYGAQGSCSANPCQQTDPLPAGSAQTYQLVSQTVGDLAPATTYHYRLLADNGNPGSPAFGEERTVTTRANDDSPDHGRFPGPPGSDRAWEQVNVAETGGNPVIGGQAFSDGGDRAVYQIPGGTPDTDSGSAFNQFFAERTPSGWVSQPILPARDQLIGPNFTPPFATGDLSTLFAVNANSTTGQRGYWRLRPGAAPVSLYSAKASETAGFFAASDDGSRDVSAFQGTVDSAYPVEAGKVNLYDLTSGTPQLLSLLPGNTVSPCGVVSTTRPEFNLTINAARRPTHWLSADGSLLVFPSKGDDCGALTQSQLYLRDIPAGETTRISGTTISGPLCGAALAKQTPDAVFFWTQARLVAEDSSPVNCTDDEDGDVYRYDLSSGGLACVTCVIDGLDVDAAISVAVAGDGSRVYFTSPNPLLPGTPSNGAYRVDVDSGGLAFVAPWDPNARLSDTFTNGNAINPDGSVFVFRSDRESLNPLGGLQNGGTAQYYRYDDHDRSLTCVSCPQGGSAPAQAASTVLAQATSFPEVGPNADPLDDDGEVFVFATPVGLVTGDQNTSSTGNPALGTDIYEWRGGRLLLLTDGLTRWPHEEVVPAVNGVSPDGRDVFFTASARYTPDAPDSYNRLYDARIGGGFEFPVPPPPCSLEVCQGTPKGAPVSPRFGSESYLGPGNLKPTATRKARKACAKGKVRRKARCVKKAKRHRSKGRRVKR